MIYFHGYRFLLFCIPEIRKLAEALSIRRCGDDSFDCRYPRRPHTALRRRTPREVLMRTYRTWRPPQGVAQPAYVSPMSDCDISSFPIAGLLAALGARPGKYKNTYHSPFRKDRDASLHIDPDRNIWYDHGAGIGGGNVDLVMRCKDCTAAEAAQYIHSLPPPAPPKSGTPLPAGGGTPRLARTSLNRIVRVQYLHSSYFFEYFRERGISAPLAARYCREVTLRGKPLGRTYDNIGFLNNSGGYALKSPSGFKSTTKAGVSTIDTTGVFSDRPTSVTVTVFEGFFDFLSWLSSAKIEIPSTDVVVLNSVANIGRAIPYLWSHHTVVCCLDHDEAGRNALEAIRSVRTVLRNPTIIDGSLFYFDYNDVNEWWMAMIRLLDK